MHESRDVPDGASLFFLCRRERKVCNLNNGLDLELVRAAEDINRLLARYGVRFGLYRKGTFHEQLFPFDPIPRVITAPEFALLEKGLSQRAAALNCFLNDIYGKKQIVSDNVVPADFVAASSGYLVPCEGFKPSKGIWNHISGIDLVKARDGKWIILEDNLRVPSGASYPLIARSISRICCPDVFHQTRIEDNRDYGEILKHTMDYVNCGGINVVLTPGRYNAAYFEHSYLAERTGAELVTGSDLVVEDNVCYLKTYDNRKQRVGAIYRRISDDYLDPMTFCPESVIGVPHLFDVVRAGNVALLNAPGNGVADDKGIYYFVPKMIRYYLNEEPVLSNAPTYLPFYEEDKKYCEANFDTLVFKDVAEAGGYGVVFTDRLSAKEKEKFRDLVFSEPRRFIAQNVIDFEDLDILEDGQEVPRKADLRAFVLLSEKPVVWKSGLTRFSRNPDSFVVNSSQGGGFKDTWVEQC